MDIIGNEFLVIIVVACGIITITLSSISSCAKRESAKTRKVLKQQEISKAPSYQHFICNNTNKATPLLDDYKGPNLNRINLGQREEISQAKQINEIDGGLEKLTERVPTIITYVTDINVNNDCLEEQTTAAEIGTTSTQMTSTVTSTQSRLNLNPNLNSSHLASKSNSTVELATDNEKGPIKLESNAGDRTEKKSWNARWCCPRCSGERVQNSVKRKGNDKSCLEKELIGDYKLLESVATMVQKYEEKSRLESEQDTCNF